MERLTSKPAKRYKPKASHPWKVHSFLSAKADKERKEQAEKVVMYRDRMGLKA